MAQLLAVSGPNSTMLAVAPTPEFLEAFRRKAGVGGRLRFDRFVELALYDQGVGYYAAKRTRVGRSPDTDFYTAVSVGRGASGRAPEGGTSFGRLMAAAAARLAGEHRSELVEVGAEPRAGTFDCVAHGFGALRTVTRGTPWTPPDPDGAVFANEVLDAQPFRRMVLRKGSWLEIEVLESEDRLIEVDGPPAEVPIALPDAADGTVLDLPLQAVDLAATWAAGSWRGVLLIVDYGLLWDDLRTTPRSTARGYRNHRTISNLLDGPGTTDLTCHVCWDWIEDAVRSAGWHDVRVVSLETFLVREAAQELEAYVRAEVSPAERFSQNRQLQELLHPGRLGRKFQVLVARR